MKTSQSSRTLENSRRILHTVLAIVFFAIGSIPIMWTRASAVSAQLTSRVAASTTAAAGASFTFGIQFRLPSSSIVRQIEIEFCTTPLGTCSATPGTDIPIVPASSTITMNNTSGTDFWTDATTFGSYSRSGGSEGGTDNQLTINRASSTSETQSGTDDRGFTFSGFTNSSGVNQTYYPRIRMYSDLGTTQVYHGATAQSTSQTLMVNARVQEVLAFCIGTTGVDDATSQITNNSSANVVTCAQADGTSIDLGVVTNSTINTTPVDITNGGDDKLAYAMVQTNAQNGISIGYRAIQDAGSGKLKTIASTCSGTSNTDQCFNSAGGSAVGFTPGTEKFGMTVAGVNCANTSVSYTCNYATTGSNLCLTPDYSQAGYTCGTGNTYVTTANLNSDTTTYAWDDSGSTLVTLADSASSSLKVVANEALMLKFAATAAITTPTGMYQAQADFVATPTY